MAPIVVRGLVLAALFSGVLAGTPKACLNPSLSCKETPTSLDLCCFNSPGGQLLLTQFWDYSPSTGPDNAWTLHGLWPDHCDGTFDANCDPSRERSNIRSILQSFGKTALLSYMDTYWKDQNGADESFWSHEWNKHGTCISTLKPSCYSGYITDQELVDFFQTATDLNKRLDTYSTLYNAGIIPSNSATYTSAQIQAAFTSAFGFPVTIGCTSGAFNQVWYSFDVRGSVQTGIFVPTNPDGSKSTCPATGIKYIPKSGGAPPPPGTTAKPPPPTPTTVPPTLTTQPTTAPQPTPTGNPSVFSGKGYLNAITGGSQTGCLISKGTWYVGGTCATYTATPSGSGFTLASSKGSCSISNSIFTCGGGASDVFTAPDGFLSAGGVAVFSAASVPSGSTQVAVYTTSQGVDVQFTWQAI